MRGVRPRPEMIPAGGCVAVLLIAGLVSAAPVVTVEPAEVRQGSYVVIRAMGLPAEFMVIGNAGMPGKGPVAGAFGVRVPMFRDGDGWRGMAAVPLSASRTRHPVIVRYGRGRSVSSRVRVTARPERRTSRRVGIAISSDASAKMRDDRTGFIRALRSVDPVAAWDGPLRRPVFGRISSPFGITRSYRATASWPHRGMDVAAPTGWPIVAAAPGRVVASGFLETYGNYVIVDHGQTVHTAYLHMTARVARTGDVVFAGTVLGTVGMTGLATGPHLHFGTYIGTTAVDPEEMLARGLPAAATISTIHLQGRL